jgi:hypothetical protein
LAPAARAPAAIASWKYTRRSFEIGTDILLRREKHNNGFVSAAVSMQKEWPDYLMVAMN